MTTRNRPTESPEVEPAGPIPAPKTEGMFRGWGVRF